MKKSLIVFAVLAIILTSCLAFTACSDPLNVTIVPVDYSAVLNDYLKYPDEANVTSMQAVDRNVADIYADASLTDAEKVAQIMDRATYNEMECEYFTYFMDKVGTTNLGDNSGTLLYQRLRRQSDTLKDDTTIKLPVNHNFDAMASSFVTAADIRYVKDGKYFRMDCGASDMSYDSKTGLVVGSNWKKQSRGNWNKTENAADSRSYEEARKTVINWSVDGIVDSEGIVIEKKVDEATGKEYFSLTFQIDVAVANADTNGKTSTIGRLENDNGGSGMKFEYCKFNVQIWDCGLAKYYEIEESWSGTIAIYSGSAQSVTKVVFSYSEADMDDSASLAIRDSIGV